MKPSFKKFWRTICDGFFQVGPVVFFCGAIVIVIISRISSWSESRDADLYGKEQEGYDRGYSTGYESGYENGYFEGKTDAQFSLADSVSEDLSKLDNKIEDEYGLDAEDAIKILSNYADVPEDVSKDELIEAIWAIYDYYRESDKIIRSIDYRDID